MWDGGGGIVFVIYTLARACSCTIPHCGFVVPGPIVAHDRQNVEAWIQATTDRGAVLCTTCDEGGKGRVIFINKLVELLIV